MAGCPELETPEPNHVSRRERIRDAMGNGSDLPAILDIKWEQKRNGTQRTPTWRANYRCPDPAA